MSPPKLSNLPRRLTWEYLNSRELSDKKQSQLFLRFMLCSKQNLHLTSRHIQGLFFQVRGKGLYIHSSHFKNSDCGFEFCREKEYYIQPKSRFPYFRELNFDELVLLKILKLTKPRIQLLSVNFHDVREELFGEMVDGVVKENLHLHVFHMDPKAVEFISKTKESISHLCSGFFLVYDKIGVLNLKRWTACSLGFTRFGPLTFTFPHNLTELDISNVRTDHDNILDLFVENKQSIEILTLQTSKFVTSQSIVKLYCRHFPNLNTINVIHDGSWFETIESDKLAKKLLNVYENMWKFKESLDGCVKQCNMYLSQKLENINSDVSPSQLIQLINQNDTILQRFQFQQLNFAPFTQKQGLHLWFNERDDDFLMDIKFQWKMEWN